MAIRSGGLIKCYLLGSNIGKQGILNESQVIESDWMRIVSHVSYLDHIFGIRKAGRDTEGPDNT